MTDVIVLGDPSEFVVWMSVVEVRGGGVVVGLLLVVSSVDLELDPRLGLFMELGGWGVGWGVGVGSGVP
ncbi:hypothetical protein ACKS0A_07357 [Histoplasma ohiense]